MADAIIKVNVDKLSDADLLAVAKKHRKGLNDFPVVFAAGAGYIAAIDPLIVTADAAVTAFDNLKQTRALLTIQKNQAIDALRAQTKLGAKYVDLTAKGDPAVMTQGGFGPRDAAGPALIIAPLGLDATFGDVSGAISLHWNPLDNTTGFIVQFRVANSNAAWQNSAPVSASHMQLTGLTPGELYEIRVCGVFAGQSQPGPACDTIQHRAA